jgi:hypothetical protein
MKGLSPEVSSGGRLRIAATVVNEGRKAGFACAVMFRLVDDHGQADVYSGRLAGRSVGTVGPSAWSIRPGAVRMALATYRYDDYEDDTDYFFEVWAECREPAVRSRSYFFGVNFAQVALAVTTLSRRPCDRGPRLDEQCDDVVLRSSIFPGG